MVFAAGRAVVGGSFKYGRNIARDARSKKTRMGAAGSVAGGVAGAPMALLAESAKDLMKPKGKFWSILTKNKSVLGINLGIGSLLKQSQVFTSGVSSVLQIIGAIVDVFIAPFFIPLVVPLIKKLAGFIPVVREKAQALADKWVPIIKEKFEKIWNGDGSFFSKIIDSVGATVGSILEITGIKKWWAEAQGIIGVVREGIDLIQTTLGLLGLKGDGPQELKDLNAMEKRISSNVSSPSAFGGVTPDMFGTGTNDRAGAGSSYDRAVASANRDMSMYANMSMYNNMQLNSDNDLVMSIGQDEGGTPNKKELADSNKNQAWVLYADDPDN